MKITVEAATLRQAIDHASLALRKRVGIPILKNVLIEAQGGWLTLRATDLDCEVSSTIGAEGIETPGSVTVNSSKLLALAKDWTPGSLVEVETGEAGKLILRHWSASSTLSTLPADDMPKMQGQDWTHGFVLPAAVLLAEMNRVRHAICTEKYRYYLNGIRWNAEAGMLRMVASDGYRLAKSEIDAPDGSANLSPIIVPTKTVDILRKILAARKGLDVYVKIGPNQLRFCLGGTRVTSNPVDGTFPEYERVIPRQNTITLEVDRKAFANSLKRLVKLSGMRKAPIKFDASTPELMLSTIDKDGGNQTEYLTAHSSAPITIGFNGRHVLDMLKVLSGKTVSIHLADERSPVLVKDGRQEYVLIPMHPV